METRLVDYLGELACPQLRQALVLEIEGERLAEVVQQLETLELLLIESLRYGSFTLVKNIL